MIASDSAGVARHRTGARRRPLAPPVRYPTALGDCFRAILRPGAPEPVGLSVGSGQEGLEVALGFIRTFDERATGQAVVVPDFVCPSVPAAARVAGFEPRPCELDPATWTYRPEALEAAVDDDVAAVVLVAYFGFLPDSGELEPWLAEVPVVEDLAQAFGVEEGVGLWPTSSFRVFSFARGKSLPLAWGGWLTGRGRREREWLEAEAARRGPGSAVSAGCNLALAQLQCLVLTPAVWRWLPLSERMVRGGAVRARRGPLGRLVRRYVAATRTLAPEIEARRGNVRRMVESLTDVEGVGVAESVAAARGVALRLPIVFDDSEAAGAVRAALRREGVIKGPNDFDDYVGGSENSAAIARRLVTLPTYRGSEAAQEAAVAILRRELGDRRA